MQPLEADDKPKILCEFVTQVGQAHPYETLVQVGILGILAIIANLAILAVLLINPSVLCRRLQNHVPYM